MENSNMAVRRIDELGRLVIPIETRRNIGLEEGEPVEIYVNETENAIIIKKSISTCVFCGTMDNLRTLKKRYICDNCLKLANKISIGEVAY